MSVRLLVTGAGGFIGSRLIDALVAEGTPVVALDTRMDARVHPWAAGGPVQLVEHDLTTAGRLPAAIADTDTVVHLAALMDDTVDVPGSGAQSVDVNVLGLMRLLEQTPRARHVIFASTIMVYADPPHYAPIDETHPTVPPNVYGATKLAAEQYLAVYGRQTGAVVTVLRLCGVFGPGTHAASMRHRAIPRFIDDVRAGRAPQVYGDGSEKRDYVYVDDVVRAIRLAMECRRQGVFNIGSGRAVSVLELAQTVIDVAGADLEPAFLRQRAAGGDYSVDITAARRDLGYAPSYGLRDGLRRQVAWHAEMVAAQ